MAELVLGPLLRFAGTEDATVWVETDAACTVEVRIEGAEPGSERTFCVLGHHYALVHCEGLPPDAQRPTRCASTASACGPSPTATSRPA